MGRAAVRGDLLPLRLGQLTARGHPHHQGGFLPDGGQQPPWRGSRCVWGTNFPAPARSLDLPFWTHRLDTQPSSSMRVLPVAVLFLATGLLSFQDPSESAEAKSKAKPIEPELLALFDYDEEADLEIEEAEYLEESRYTRADLSYASPAGGRVPAYLFQPKGEGPYAGIVLMHGMPGSRDDALNMAPGYVQAGAVVLAISAPWARPDGPREDVLRFDPRDRAEQIQLIQDLRRAVDLLESLDNVDSERLAYVGGSYGGAMGGLLAGVETRLKAYALMVGDGGLVAHFTGAEDGGYEELGITKESWDTWVNLMKPIEPMRFVAHAAPAHLLFQNGKVDKLVPAADAKAYQEAGSEPKTIKWYDGGHAITGDRIHDQMIWLSELIGTRKPE